MSGVLTTVLVVYVPVCIICGLAYLWSRNTRLPWLSKLLRRSAILWQIWLTLAFGAGFIPPLFCQGNFLYRYHDCTVISEQFALGLVGFNLISFIAGIVYGIILFSAAGMTTLLAAPDVDD